MLVEPTPVRPPSRRSRIRLALSVGAVPVVLAGVVWLGLAGSARPEPSKLTSAASPGTVSSEPGESRPPRPGVLAFPETAIGLSVDSVEKSVDDELHGRAQGLVAVAGYLSIVGPREACPWLAFIPDDLYCQRELILASRPDPEPGAPILHPTVMPGVPVPTAGPDGSRVGEPVPAVVVGVFGETRAGGCFVEGKPCGPSFVVESVVWADGTWQRRGPDLGPGIDADDIQLESRLRREIRSYNLPGRGIPLFEAALRPMTLETVDPQAATALGDKPPDLVWYLRLASPPTEGTNRRDVAWLVIDDASGLILAGWDPVTGYSWPTDAGVTDAEAADAGAAGA